MEGWKGLRSLTDERTFSVHCCELPAIDLAQFDRLLDKWERELPAWRSLEKRGSSEEEESDKEEDPEDNGSACSGEDGECKETEEKPEGEVQPALEAYTVSLLSLFSSLSL